MNEDTTTLPTELNGKEPLVLNGDIYSSPSVFDHVQRIAKVYAHSEWVPERFRGKVADCIIALELSNRLQVPPLMVMAKSYVVHGKMGIEGQLAIALVNSRGPYTQGVKFRKEGEGDGLKVTAYGVRKDTGEEESYTLSYAQAKAMGWVARNEMWKHNPELMLKYRTGAWLARVHCPEILLGLEVVDEILDVHGVQVVKQPASQRVKEKLKTLGE